MKNRKSVILIFICLAIIIAMLIYRCTAENEENPNQNVVTTGQVARSISLLFHTPAEIKELDKDYFNGSSDKWYVSYMNMMYNDTYFLEKDIKATDKSAIESFTYNDLENLLTNMGVVDKEILSYVKNNKASKAIINSEWNEIYGKMVALLDSKNTISKIEMNIVATVSNAPTLPSWNTVTTEGTYLFTGLSMDYYIDKRVSVLVKENEILCILEVISTEISYNNVWVISIENGKIKTYIDGAVREFEIDDKTITYSSVIADINLKNRKIKDYTVKGSAVSGKVLTSSNAGIELEGQGFFELDDNYRVYKTYGNLQMKSIKDVVVGYDIQKFIVIDNKICAVVIDRDMNAKNIRVLLKTTGFSEILHSNVVLSSDVSCEISYGTTLEVIPAGTQLSFDVNSPYLASGRIKITPQNVNGRVKVESIERGYGKPSYRGSIEVAVVDGALVIINELPMEQYLYAVVPSEMPYTYNGEALKAQAICARSYAYKQLLGNAYSALGAHVDDSTSFQVYNNSEERATTTEAVDATYGEVMMCGEEVITAFFYSTSCGSSTDATVWGGSGLNYIKGRLLVNEDPGIDLAIEINFDTFIRNQFSTFDSSYPWYRWSIKMTLEDISTTINSVIGSLYNGGSEKVLTLNQSGEWVSTPISSVGDVKKIEVGSRSTGGVLNYIIIHGTQATVKIYTESYIRKLFYPVSSSFVRSDGSENNSFDMLPSAFAVFDPIAESGTLTGYNIIGGGYGHGVGLSQNGANTMGNNGESYDKILGFFYCNMNLKKIY